MKTTLLATTLLVATAGLSAAEVNLSGSGRFGVTYVNNGFFGSFTTVDTRLTINVDAKMETDGGVTFGGRIRFRHNDGADGTMGSKALLYMETSGLRVEVGNANGAYDSAGLIWNSEIGYTDNSFGDPFASYIGFFESVPDGYGALMGIFASYSMGDFTARVSYHDYEQSVAGNTETSVSVDYASGAFAVSAAYVSSEYWGQDNYFLGGQYTIGDSTNVGLLYNDGDAARSVTLYGNHTMASGLTIAGYLTDREGAVDTGLGIGASYPLGNGAAIKGAYHTAGPSVAFADLGVTFSF